MSKIPAFERPFYDIPGPIAIAHRGGNAAGPEKENSMLAFQSAHDLGLTYVETDTVLTKDGIPLAFHGSNSAKQEAKTGLPERSFVQSMTLKQLKDHGVTVGGEEIPTLEEVMTTYPEMRFFIDPKTPQVVPALGNLITKLKAEDRVSVGAFSRKRSKGSVEYAGGQDVVATSHAIIGAIAMLGLKTAGTSPFVRPFFNVSGAVSLQMPHNLVTSKVVERAHDLGVAVITWPSKPELNDNENYINTVIDMGVHGLMSDHTGLMKSIVLARDPKNQSIKPR